MPVAIALLAPQEIAYIKALIEERAFTLQLEQAKPAGASFAEKVLALAPTQRMIRIALTKLKEQPAKRAWLADALMRLSKADGRITPDEVETIRAMTQWLRGTIASGTAAAIAARTE